MNKEMLIRFLENNPVQFDLSNDCTKDVSYVCREGYDKYFAYKTQNSVGDPDLKSVLLQEIYKLLWAEALSQEWMNVRGWIQSDTMTSVQFTMAEYMKDTFCTEVKQYMCENPRQRYVSVNMCKAMYEGMSTVNSQLNGNENFLRFVSVYHTIGNYVPVPRGFNTARSGNFGSHDYWDLTLMMIKEYYDLRDKKKIFRKQPEVVLEVLLNSPDSIYTCKSWLDFYESWNEFVEKNYFQDYVDRNGNVIPFCKGHAWGNGKNKISNYDEFFLNAWRRIEARGYRIVSALCNKLSI